MFSFRSSSRKQFGFTLLEMLLAVGITGAVMLVVSRATTEMIQQRNAQTAGQQLERMTELTEGVLLNRGPTLHGGGGAGVILSAQSPEGTGHANQALAALINNNFPVNNNSFRIANSPVEVAYGLVASGTGSGLMIRTFAYLRNPFPTMTAIRIARAAGGRGGIISSTNSNVIRSAFGNWSYPIPNDVAGLLNFNGSLATDTSYVVVYSAYSQTDLKGPYLSSYGGGEGENVMHTDILMNGNSIIGAKDIEVGTMTATKAARFEELAVNGQATFQGGLDANNAVNVAGDLNVTGGDLNVTNGNLHADGGEISAKGLRADTLEAEDLTTKDLSTETLTVDGGDTLITSNLTVSGGASLDITGPLKATVVDAGSITTDTMKTKTLEVKDQAVLRGATTIENTTNIDQLILNGQMNLNGTCYGAGC